MIKVQHWKLYASHYNDDDDTLGIGLELKKLQFKYSNYEKMGVPVLTGILDSCWIYFSRHKFPCLYDMTRMEDYNSALAIERTGCCVTKIEYETATDIGINIVSDSISFFNWIHLWNKPIGALPSWQLLAVWYLDSIHSMYDT
jgi:hypothetical protein